MREREMLPQFSVYANYYLYGQNPDNLFKSLGDLSNRNFAVGISSVFTPFDGFKNAAQKERIKLEIEKLKLQRDKKIAELKDQYERFNALASQENQRNEEDLIALINQKIEMIQKLLDQQLENKETYLNEEATLINQKLELEKSIINRVSSIKRLNILCAE